MFIKLIILAYLCIWAYEIIDNFKVAPEQPKPLKDIWQHPFIIAAGLENPIPLIEAEEENPEWAIEYFEDKDNQPDFETTIINKNEPLKNSRLNNRNRDHISLPNFVNTLYLDRE